MRPRRRDQRHPRLLVFAPVNGAAPSVVAAVLEQARPHAGVRLALGCVAAVIVFGALAAWAVHRPDRRPDVIVLPPELAVELFEIPPPAAPPPVAPPRSASRPLSSPSKVPSLAPTEQPPAPAQAAEVVAREPAPEEAVDLTAFSITTGNAARFSGGDTASSGTSLRAATGAVVDGQGPSAPGAGARGRDLSRAVGISDTEWRDCAWPREADALGIDEQVVSMRAIASAGGGFESADVLDDPGHGFGAALLSCARRHGFVPALDRQGHPVRARSGVIRFTFTRLSAR